MPYTEKMTKLHKRILTSIAIVIVLTGVGVFFLIKNANQILKSQLEKTLGKDFRVERIVLNWGSVDAYGIKLLRDDEEIARAESINIKADFLSFLKKHYSVSGITIEKPYFRIVIDKQGNIVVPFAGNIAEKKEKARAGTAFEIGKIIINNGQLIAVDERLPSSQNEIALKNFNLVLDDFASPFRNTFSSIRLTTESEGRIISGGISAAGKVNLKSGAVDINISGNNVVLLNLDQKGPVFSTDKMLLSVASKEDRTGKVYTLDNVSHKRPYLQIDTDNEGDLVSPWKDIIEELQKIFAASGK